MRKYSEVHRGETLPQSKPRENACRQCPRPEVPRLLVQYVKGKGSLVRSSEDQSQTTHQVERTDIAQQRLGLREAQGETDLCNPRVGELLSACRDAQLSKGNR